MGVGKLVPGGLDSPDLGGVITDRTIAGELARGGDVVDAHLCPLGRVLVDLADLVLHLNVGLEVGKQKVTIVLQQDIYEILELLGVAGAEVAALDLVHALADLGVRVVVGVGVVAAPLQGLHLLHRHAEDEHVLLSHLLGHLHVSSVQCSDGEGAIEHELHVTGSGSFRAGRGDLFRQVGGRDDLFCQCDAVVLQEHHLETVSHDGVGVDGGRHGADEADDLLGDVVAGGGLATDHDGAGAVVAVGVALDAVVHGDDVQAVEQLALVLVDALDLDVEHGGGVDAYSVVTLQHGCQAQLVLLLHRHNGALEVRIGGPALELLQLFQMHGPVFSDLLADEVGQAGVAEQQPTTGSDAIGLILESFGEHLKEVLEQIILDDLGVNARHSIDGVGADDGEVGHVHALVSIFLNERHATHAVSISGPTLGHGIQVVVVDLVDDLHVAGQDVLHEGDRPTLQGLGEHGVVGVGAGLHGKVPGLVPAESLHVHQNPHKLSHGQGRMGVIELDSHLIGEGGEGGPDWLARSELGRLEAPDNIL